MWKMSRLQGYKNNYLLKNIKKKKLNQIKVIVFHVSGRDDTEKKGKWWR